MASSHDENLNTSTVLDDLNVTFPDIRLDADRCHPLCSLSDDHRSMIWRGGSADVFASENRSQFLGTCGTQALSGRVYWQVRVRIHMQCALSSTESGTWKLLAEVGFSSQEFIPENSVATLPQEKCSFSVKLCTNNKVLVLAIFEESCLREVVSLTSAGEVDGRIGFFLDTNLGQLVIMDISARRVLYDTSKKLLSGLYPLVGLAKDFAVSDADVRLTVESGQALTTWPPVMSALGCVARHLLQSSARLAAVMSQGGCSSGSSASLSSEAHPNMRSDA